MRHRSLHIRTEIVPYIHQSGTTKLYFTRLSPLIFFFYFFFFSFSLIPFIAVVPICLVCDSSIVATCSSIPAARFVFVSLLFILFLFFVGVFLVTKAETRARVGRPQTSSTLPVISLQAVPRRLFCFGSLV